MIVALSLLAMAVALVLIWRGHDVRVVLLAASLGIALLADSVEPVFRKAAESLADARFVLPICSAMGFAYVVRETGCVAALVRLLIRPLARAPRALVIGSAAIALVVNMAIPSQTSTLAAVGPLAVALMARLGTRALEAGSALVLGASVAGALLNPGVAEIATAAQLTERAAPRLVVTLAPAVGLAFAVGMALLFVFGRLGRRRDDAPLAAAETADEGGGRADFLKALIPPLPVVWLLLGHPSLPWHDFMARAMPRGLEVFTAMVAGSALAIAFATRKRARATRALFDGMGWAFAQVITIIAVSSAAAKALECAGVLSAFVSLASGHALAALLLAFALAFGLALLSGSGTAASVALMTAFAPQAAELGVSVSALAAVILFAAEAGRTCSPVAAVLLFGAELVAVPPRRLALRLVLPCLGAGAAGAALGAALA